MRLCYVRRVNAKQCRAARALLGWTLDDLSARSKISITTINHFETEQSRTRASTIQLLRLTLEAAGIEFLENGSGPGLRLRTPVETDPSP